MVWQILPINKLFLALNDLDLKNLSSELAQCHHESFKRKTSKFRELGSPARQHIGQRSRSQGQTFWYQWKGLATRNTHMKYESCISSQSKVMAHVKDS